MSGIYFSKTIRQGDVLHWDGFEYVRHQSGDAHRWRCRNTSTCFVNVTYVDDIVTVEGEHTHLTEDVEPFGDPLGEHTHLPEDVEPFGDPLDVDGEEEGDSFSWVEDDEEDEDDVYEDTNFELSSKKKKKKPFNLEKALGDRDDKKDDEPISEATVDDEELQFAGKKQYLEKTLGDRDHKKEPVGAAAAADDEELQFAGKKKKATKKTADEESAAVTTETTIKDEEKAPQFGKKKKKDDEGNMADDDGEDFGDFKPKGKAASKSVKFADADVDAKSREEWYAEFVDDADAENIKPHEDPRYILHSLKGFNSSEISRLMLRYAGQQFEDLQYDLVNEWAVAKAIAPDGIVPWLEGSGKALSGGLVIARHLAQTLNLAGASLGEEAEVEALVSKGLSISAASEGTESIGAIERLFDELESLELQVRGNQGGEGFFVGDKVSWGDFAVVVFLEKLRRLNDKMLDNYPFLTAHTARVLGLKGAG